MVRSMPATRRDTSGSRLLTIEVGTLFNQHHNGVGVAAKRGPMNGGNHLIWDAAWLAVPNVFPHDPCQESKCHSRVMQRRALWCFTIHGGSASAGANAHCSRDDCRAISSHHCTVRMMHI